MYRVLETFAITIGKIIIFLARKLHLGGGSNFPGRVALRFCPRLALHLSQRFADGVVIITATNGKTTTSGMVAVGLRNAGVQPVHNAAGANMLPGIVTTMIEAVSLRGRFRERIGLFEVDEGSLPVVAARLQPRLALIGNFFRDQLDRYGEVTILADAVGRALRSCEPPPRLVANGDDPIVARLGKDWPVETVWFGIDDPAAAQSGLQQEADIRNCPFCMAAFEYTEVYLGHQGAFCCPSCGFSRPELQITAGGVTRHGLDGISFDYCRNGTPVTRYRLPVPGDHLIYNLLGGLALLEQLGVEPGPDSAALFSRFRVPYGRFERITWQDHPLYLVLVKNPAGANVVLRLLAETVSDGRFLLLLNDLAADGRDISWIWDARFELLAEAARVVTGGRRAADMALRAVYAGVPQERVAVCSAAGEALDCALSGLPDGAPLFILATYTAMHSVRAVLAERGAVGQFWEEQQ